MFKKVMKWFLLAFVAATVIAEVTKGGRRVDEVTFSDGKHLVFFHAKVRCPTCTAMERLINQTLDADFSDELQSGVFDFRIMDYESPKSKQIVEKYQIATATLLLFEQKGGEYSQGKNLATQCWSLVGDEPAFRTMVKTELDLFIQGGDSPIAPNENETELAPDLNLFED